MRKWIVNDRKDLPWTEDKEVSEGEQRGLYDWREEVRGRQEAGKESS